jgi:hypothetical protein
LLFLVGVVLAACGGGNANPITTDAAPGADAGADAPPSFVACAGFSAAGVAVPAHITGNLGTASVQSPSSCSTVDAPFGIESAGPDRVIPLTNLSPGAGYVVKLTSASDLSFYVVTGCSTATGPGPDQCQLFEDAAGGGDPEVGRFVAGGSTAYVVIDYYASSSPPSSAFALDVYAEQCQDGTQCSSQTPACFEGHCVGCVTSFDCTAAAAPVCDASQACVAGTDSCTTDGSDEPGNDGPAGATMIVLDGSGHGVVSGKICSDPRTEYDYFAFDVTSLGQTWAFSLGWLGGRDLDLHVFDATGTELGLSFWEQPEQIRLTYLPLGRYYVRVREFVSTPDASPVTYTLTTQRTLGVGCTSSADCAAEYRNQLFRGACSAGACIPIEGNGAVAEGGACDSQSDCALALQCPSFYFVSDGDTRETCSRSCSDDSGCAALGAGEVCTTYFSSNFCVQKCTADDQCPTAISSPPASGPWRRLSCDLPTGRCVP